MVDVKKPVIDDLNQRVEKAGSQTAAAKEIGISPSHISDVLSGKRNLSARKLKELGYEKVVAYVSAVAVPDVVRAIETAQGEAEHIRKLKSKVEPKIKSLSRK